MRASSFYDEGLVISDDGLELAKFVASITKHTAEEVEDDLMSCLEDAEGYIGDYCLIRVNDGYAEGFHLSNIAGEDVDLDSEILIIPTKKASSITEAAYGSEEELITEFRSKYGEYLPCGFDYRTHIGRIFGVVYG